MSLQLSNLREAEAQDDCERRVNYAGHKEIEIGAVLLQTHERVERKDMHCLAASRAHGPITQPEHRQVT